LPQPLNNKPRSFPIVPAHNSFMFNKLFRMELIDHWIRLAIAAHELMPPIPSPSKGLKLNFLELDPVQGHFHPARRSPKFLRAFPMHGTAPTSQKEVELKLELAPTSLPALKRVPLLRSFKTPPRSTTEVSVYFDTKKHKLRRKGLTLRVRRVGDRRVQTIKAGNSAFERGEWEAEIASDEPDLSLATGTALEPLVNDKLSRQLKPLFETRVRRTVYPIADETCAIALSVDRGKIRTDRHSAPLCEIELELERGSPARLFDAARDLTHDIAVRLAVKSKPERGYELIDGSRDAPVRAVPSMLSAGASTREAFQMIGRACLKQVAANEPALLKGNPEGVHQMRVGLRRLRAAMSLFKALLGDAQTHAIKAELKWLTGELGPARELEVLVKRVVAPMQKQHGRWDGIPSLLHALAEKRESALLRAQETVKSARFRAFTLDLAAWLEAGDWTSPEDDLVRDRGELPIEVSAAEQLTRRWRKIRKKGKTLAKLDARDRHKLRIQSKKLRYAVEFFADVFAGKRAAKPRKRLLAALERLQDGLGDLNDIAVHEERIAAIGIRCPHPTRKRAFAAGVLTGREDARMDAAMSAATHAHADLARIKPFWPDL
jgi:triphosphatase